MAGLLNPSFFNAGWAQESEVSTCARFPFASVYLMTFDQCFYEDGVWSLDQSNDAAVDEDAEWPNALSYWMEEEFCVRKACPFCGFQLENCGYFEEEDGDLLSPAARCEAPDLVMLWSCPFCAFWQWYSILENRGLHGAAAMSVLRTFDPTIPEGCWSELSQHLRRNESLWHSLNPTVMERLVAEIFRANYVGAEVIHVGRPGDRGTDVLFVDSGVHQWLISVKRRGRERAVEPFETLQKLLGTLVIEGQQRGIIASNAHHFSYQVQREVKRVRQLGYTVELLDRGKLHRMLGALLPDRPWSSDLLRSGIPTELVQRFERTTTAIHQLGLFSNW
jgi:hypothetical protein